MKPPQILLDAQNVVSGYGNGQVLFGVSLSVSAGEAVTLIGRNGMGKTTAIRTFMGQLAIQAGEVRFAGTLLNGMPGHRIARLGIGLVPEGRHIFPNLTVRENLLMAARTATAQRTPWTYESVLSFFPRLAERTHNGGAQLSGGEQQMLAIGRALMTNPTLLILDEATEGLAPVVRDEIWARLKELKKAGLAILLIDKDIDAMQSFVDRHYVMEKGEIVWSGCASSLASSPEVQCKYLAI